MENYFNVSFIREFRVPLSCSKEIFLNRLKNAEHGTITGDRFQLRPHEITFIDSTNATNVAVHGTVADDDDGCVVTIEADAFNGSMAIGSVAITIGCLIAILVALFVPDLAIVPRLGVIVVAISVMAVLSLYARRQLDSLESRITRELRSMMGEDR